MSKEKMSERIENQINNEMTKPKRKYTKNLNRIKKPSRGNFYVWLKSIQIEKKTNKNKHLNNLSEECRNKIKQYFVKKYIDKWIKIMNNDLKETRKNMNFEVNAFIL